jgi:hypothetical protein
MLPERMLLSAPEPPRFLSTGSLFYCVDSLALYFINPLLVDHNLMRAIIT